jgi:hypothetical protein
MLIYWLCRQAEFTIDSCTRNHTVLQFVYSLVITLKTFTLNHNTQSRCNTLWTVLILHWAIPCILTCALLAASLIHLLTELARTNNSYWSCCSCCFSSTPLFHSYITGRLTTNNSYWILHCLRSLLSTLESNTRRTQRRVLLVSADRTENIALLLLLRGD